MVIEEVRSEEQMRYIESVLTNWRMNKVLLRINIHCKEEHFR